ncbi:hypothetical protein MKX01_005489 [Papaver californicum]|nr:hypothetical protein MKX01_005489 [Papaver californicum]
MKDSSSEVQKVKEDKYRSYLYGEGEKDTEWRYGVPNYDVVNKLFEDGRTKVQNLVKTWEMEMFHKTRLEDFKTIDPSNYMFSLNGRKLISFEEKREQGGGYNSLLQTSLPEKYRLYNPSEETTDSAPVAITTTFPRGFAVEILQVYSGPPVILDERKKIVKAEFFFDRGKLLGALIKGDHNSVNETTSGCPFLKNTG